MKPEGKPIAGMRPEVAESTPLPHNISVPLRFPTDFFLFQFISSVPATYSANLILLFRLS